MRLIVSLLLINLLSSGCWTAIPFPTLNVKTLVETNPQPEDPPSDPPVVTDSSIVIEWDLVTEDVEGNQETIAYYDVFVNEQWRHGVALGNQATVTLSDGDQVTVKAIDEAGNVSVASVPFLYVKE